MVTTTEAVAGSATVSVPVPVLVSGPVSVSVRGREQHGTSLRDSAGPQGRALFVWVPPIGARVAPAVAVTPPALWEGMTQTNRPLQSRTNQPLLALELSHEMLDHIAPLLRGVAKHDRSLADQLRSAAQSVTLNLAESAGHHGGNRRLRYESALGSAYETRACRRIARSWGDVAADATGDALAIVDRVEAMTFRLLRPRQ